MKNVRTPRGGFFLTHTVGTAIKHPVPDWVKLSFAIFDIWALWHSALNIRVPGCQKLQMTAGTGCFIAVSMWQPWHQRVKLQLIQWNVCNKDR